MILNHAVSIEGKEMKESDMFAFEFEELLLAELKKACKSLTIYTKWRVSFIRENKFMVLCINSKYSKNSAQIMMHLNFLIVDKLKFELQLERYPYGDFLDAYSNELKPIVFTCVKKVFEKVSVN